MDRKVEGEKVRMEQRKKQRGREQRVWYFFFFSFLFFDLQKKKEKKRKQEKASWRVGEKQKRGRVGINTLIPPWSSDGEARRWMRWTEVLLYLSIKVSGEEVTWGRHTGLVA